MLQASCELERKLFEQVEKTTPQYVKELNLIDLKNDGRFVFTLKREHLKPYDERTNPEGLNLDCWLEGYAKEAQVSTAGIRGPQNILYPQDTRFPISLIGITLATVAKALVSRDKYGDDKLVKIAGCEVRYNSRLFLDAITRIQAAYGIKTLVPVDRKSIPIWMVSFLAFKLDLLGGEYITSSHGISVKNATKDLNSQGSQYLPEESAEFVDKIYEIFDVVRREGSYEIMFSASDDKLIDEIDMAITQDGIDFYKEYLEAGVANEYNMDLIKSLEGKIIIENVGGSAYRTLSRILHAFEVNKNFAWLNVDEDPFFHSIGKYDQDAKGNAAFYDYSVDATVLATGVDGKSYFPVIETLDYPTKLKEYRVGTVVLITDPDHDRLTIAQIDSVQNAAQLEKAGVDFVALDGERVLTVFTANQAFLMIMDFWTQKLKDSGLFDKHPRFIIKTTASAKSWDEWANANGVKVVNVPVGFKEIANVMKKVENQIIDAPDKDVTVTDVFGGCVNLGKNPRLVFAGEESGGMIIGSENLIYSIGGKMAIAMREKSAAEAIFVASALCSVLEKQGKSLAQNLVAVFAANGVIAQFDVREDIAYYNESEPDIDKLKVSKVEGEAKRTKNDMFYLALAVSKQLGKITLEQVKTVLAKTFADVDFSNLIDVKFVGDGTYLQFTDKFLEIRPSGTDAKTKAYAGGQDKTLITRYAKTLGNYSGDLSDVYLNIVDKKFYDESKDVAMKFYAEFTNKMS